MQVHYRLSDLALSPWLMVFKRRLVAIYATGVRAFHHTEITDLFTVEMRIQGEHLYISVLGSGGMYFEFQTSGMPVSTIPAGGFNIYNAAIIGVTVNAEDGLVPHAVMQGGQKTSTADKVEPLNRPAQIQLLDEPVSYPGPLQGRFGYPRALYECYAPHHPHTGVHTRAYPIEAIPFYYSTLGGSFHSHAARDILYDIPWTDGQSVAHIRRAYLTGSTDWPRASGIQIATHILWGSREFGVSVDSFDQVSVFPTGSIGPLSGSFFSPNQNLPIATVQTLRVPFPLWVYAKTQSFKDWYAANPGNADLGTVDFPEIDWKLHPDGTEMCAVVYERLQCDLNTAFFNTYATATATQGPGTYWPDATVFYDLQANGSGYGPPIETVHASVLGDKWYLNATGILQVKIKIDLTGPHPEDYTLSLSVVETRRPTTTQYCTFLAGYVWHDVKSPAYTKKDKLYDAKRGDMVTLDLEIYGHTTTGATASLYSLKNLTANKEIRVLGAGSTFTTGPLGKGNLLTYEPSILAAELKTLSFVVRDPVEEFVGAVATIHFGLTVYVMNKYADTLFPNLTPQSIRDIIKFNGTADQRAILNSTFPGITLMPLNDLRDWSDPDMLSLRETYSRSFSHQTYAPGTYPYDNWSQMESFGNLYWKTGPRDYPVTSAATLLWYNSLMGQAGLRPFAMFYLTDPRPGWYLYNACMMARIYITASCTFFTHPNGTWALFDKQWLYNQNGLEVLGTYGGSDHSFISNLDPTKIEHCVFDKVHFQLDRGGLTFKRDSTFVELYNLAIDRAKKTKKLLDNSIPINITYKDVRGFFSVSSVLDSVDPTVSYAKLLFSWYPNVEPTGHWYFVDRAYYNGSKDYFLGFESTMMGHLANYNFGAIMFRVADDVPESPLFAYTGITFSSCVAITL